jgi:hypothetical protein
MLTCYMAISNEETIIFKTELDQDLTEKYKDQVYVTHVLSQPIG